MQFNRVQQRVPRAVTFSALFAIATVAIVGIRGNAGQPPVKAPPVNPPAQALTLQNSFEEIADTLRPSVVFIKSTKSVNVPAGFQGMSDEQDPQSSPFPFNGQGGRQFRFNAPGGGQLNVPPSFSQKQNASGSGVIIREDGYILTNDHVVEGADKVTVRLQDGREFVGKVKRDYRSDLALVKIEATGLPKAELADSDKLHIGQWAIAFGSPFGLKDTMTVGIVSSLHRSEAIGGRMYPSLIQTDASINPGNSGGPLVDIYGRVIGINVAIESPSGTNAGIGFTIPSNTAKYIADELIAKGSITRGFLGLVPAEATYQEKKALGIERGAMVKSVNDGTPAQQAGIQAGDVIVRYNDKIVEDDVNLRDLISRTAPNERVKIVVNRDGKEQTLTATIGEARAMRVSANEAPVPKATTNGKLGIQIANVDDPRVKEMFNLKGDLKEGAVIVNVSPGSPAAEAGIVPGDVVTRLNGKTIKDAAQLSESARNLKEGSSVSAIIRRSSPEATQSIQVQINLE